MGWFDTREVDALADSLVREMVQRIPPQAELDKQRKGEAKLRKVHEMVLRQAGDFVAKQPLNVYKKARLASRFKFGLGDAGYPAWFIEEMTYELAAVVGSAVARQKA